MDLELRKIRDAQFDLQLLDHNNPLYEVQFPTEEDLNLLPKIKRAQIELTRFIGK